MVLRFRAMDAAGALADLTEVSAQIEGAVLAEADGTVLSSTFPEDRAGTEIARTAVELLAAADAVRPNAEEGVVQLQAAIPDGSVFVARSGQHLVAAITHPDPTAGLVFYDLRTCLRMLGEEGDGEA